MLERQTQRYPLCLLVSMTSLLEIMDGTTMTHLYPASKLLICEPKVSIDITREDSEIWVYVLNMDAHVIGVNLNL